MPTVHMSRLRAYCCGSGKGRPAPSCNQGGSELAEKGRASAEELGFTSSRRVTWRSRNEKPLDADNPQPRPVQRTGTMLGGAWLWHVEPGPPSDWRPAQVDFTMTNN